MGRVKEVADLLSRVSDGTSLLKSDIDILEEVQQNRKRKRKEKVATLIAQEPDHKFDTDAKYHETFETYHRPDVTKGMFPDFATGSSYEYRLEVPYDWAQSEALVDPIVDPFFIGTMGGGLGGKLVYSAMRKAGVPVMEALINSVGAALVTATTGALGEYAVAIPTGMAQDSGDSKAIIVNIALGVVTGLTIEHAIEKAILPQLKYLTPQAAKAATRRVKAYLGTQDGGAMLDDLVQELASGKVRPEDVLKAVRVGNDYSRTMEWADKVVENMFKEDTLQDASSLFNPLLQSAVAIKVASRLRRGFRAFPDVLREVSRALEDTTGIGVIIKKYPEAWMRTVEKAYVEEADKQGLSVQISREAEGSPALETQLQTIVERTPSKNEFSGALDDPDSGINAAGFQWNPNTAKFEAPLELPHTSTQNVINKLGIGGDPEYQQLLTKPKDMSQDVFDSVAEGTHTKKLSVMAEHLEYVVGAPQEHIDDIIRRAPTDPVLFDEWMRETFKLYKDKSNWMTSAEYEAKWTEKVTAGTRAADIEAKESIDNMLGFGKKGQTHSPSISARQHQIVAELNKITEDSAPRWTIGDQKNLDYLEKLKNSPKPLNNSQHSRLGVLQRRLSEVKEEIKKIKGHSVEKSKLMREEVKIKDEIEPLVGNRLHPSGHKKLNTLKSRKARQLTGAERARIKELEAELATIEKFPDTKEKIKPFEQEKEEPSRFSKVRKEQEKREKALGASELDRQRIAADYRDISSGAHHKAVSRSRENPIKFWSGSDKETRWMSAFADSKIEIRGIKYNSVEAYYQSSRVLSSSAWKDRIAKAKTGSDAKLLFNKVPENELERKFNTKSAREVLMLEALRARYTQNPEDAKKLLATGDRYLEHTAEWGDRLWGTTKGTGKNRFGELLMDVRNELAQERGSKLSGTKRAPGAGSTTEVVPGAGEIAPYDALESLSARANELLEKGWRNLSREERLEFKEMQRELAILRLKENENKLNMGIDFRLTEREDYEHIKLLMRMDIAQGKAKVSELFESAKESFGRHMPDDVLQAALDDISSDPMVRNDMLRINLKNDIIQGIDAQKRFYDANDKPLEKWSGESIMKARYDLETSAELLHIAKDSDSYKRLSKINTHIEIGIEAMQKDPMEYGELKNIKNVITSIREGYHISRKIAQNHSVEMFHAIRNAGFSKESQKRIYNAVSGGTRDSLTDAEKVMSDMLNNYYVRIGFILEEQGILDPVVQNYISSMYKKKKNAKKVYLAYKKKVGRFTSDDANPFLLAKQLDDEAIKRLKLERITDLGVLMQKYHQAMGQTRSELWMRDAMMTLRYHNKKLNSSIPIMATERDIRDMDRDFNGAPGAYRPIDVYDEVEKHFPDTFVTPKHLREQGPPQRSNIRPTRQYWRGILVQGPMERQADDAFWWGNLYVTEDAKQLLQSTLSIQPRTKVGKFAYHRLTDIRQVLMLDPLVHGVNLAFNALTTLDLAQPLKSNLFNLYRIGKKIEQDPVQMTKAWESGLNADSVYAAAGNMYEDVQQAMGIVMGKSLNPSHFMAKLSHATLWKMVRRLQLGAWEYEAQKLYKQGKEFGSMMGKVKDPVTGLKRGITLSEAQTRVSEEVNTRFGALPDHWKSRLFNQWSSWLLFAKNWTPSNVKQIVMTLPPSVQRVTKLDKTFFSGQTLPDHLKAGAAARYWRFWAWGAILSYTGTTLQQYAMTGKFMHENEEGRKLDLAIPEGYGPMPWGKGPQARSSELGYLYAKPSAGRTMLDAVGMFTHPVQTLRHKTHPLWTYIFDMMMNRDSYTGAPITSQEMTIPERARVRLTATAKRLLPIALISALPFQKFIPEDMKDWMDWKDPRSERVMTDEEKAVIAWGSWIRTGMQLDTTAWTTLPRGMKNEFIETLSKEEMDIFMVGIEEQVFTGDVARKLYKFTARRGIDKKKFDVRATELAQRMYRAQEDYRKYGRKIDLERADKYKQQLFLMYQTSNAYSDPFRSMVTKFGKHF